MKDIISDSLSALKVWVFNPDMLAKLSLVLVALVLAFAISELIRKRLNSQEKQARDATTLRFRKYAIQARYILFPFLAILFLGVAVEVSEQAFKKSVLVRIFQSLTVIYLLQFVVSHYVKYRLIETVFRWLVIPITVLYVLGLLEEVAQILDSVYIQFGTAKISMFDVLRTLIVGSVLFWLGRVSSNTGQRLIRRQKDIDAGTREVLAKLFQVVLVAVLFVVLLRLLGVNLTALAVFSGALGVGLGFGLQSIASNFLSGIIILLDRSLKIGDYVELEEGTGGRIREITMRSTILQTYDGKDIVVPNDQLITTQFVNWTHFDEKQRYEINFQVSYNTDLPFMIELVKNVVRSHPKVIDGPECPEEELADVEIAGFGDSGVDVLVEFWMEGIDDGENRVTADLMLLIWQALKDNDIQIPFPQREISIVDRKDA